MSDRNAERNPLKRNTLLLLLSAAVLLAIAAATLLLPGSATAPDELPPAQAVDAGDVTRVAEGCELLQTLTYTRCEHVVTRRVTAPAELYGKTLDEVAALYPEWRITEFGASLIKMEQQPDMFCCLLADRKQKNGKKHLCRPWEFCCFCWEAGFVSSPLAWSAFLHLDSGLHGQ